MGGSIGALSGSLGVSGGYSNSRSQASQEGARNIAQSFGETLRQSLLQSSEAYRELNASVVTTVEEGQQYSVTTEAVANHNHCHSLTMMYFEVLRHYAITQELAEVAECIFVPFLFTEFDEDNIAKWKDSLAQALKPISSNTYAWPFLLSTLRRQHPLAKAFDANDRVRTNWEYVNYPENTYAEDPIRSVNGHIDLRVSLPRPPTRADRILSLPVITETVVSRQVDTVATVARAFFTGGLSLFGGAEERTVEQQVLRRKDIGDRFIDLDDNFQSVPPANAVRINTFEPVSFEFFGVTVNLEFFANPEDEAQWGAYAALLGYDAPWKLLQAYFRGRLVSEWDTIWRRDIVPRVFEAITDSIVLEGDGGPGIDVDLTPNQPYRGGDRRVRMTARGGIQSRTRDALADELVVRSNSAEVRALEPYVVLNLERVRLDYTTEHFRGPIFSGSLGDDLLDGVTLPIPLTSRDLRNPRHEDRWLQQRLIDHLNAHIEHYNISLFTGLDQNRRWNLLDGFSIETYNRDGTTAGFRSLASVVKNDLITVVGNALVFPVADGYHVSRSLLTEGEGETRVSAAGTVSADPGRSTVPTVGSDERRVHGGSHGSVRFV